MRRAISAGTLISLALALVMWLPVSGQDPNAKITFTEYPEITSRNYLCHRAGKAPRIDGKLDDEAWVKAPWSEAFGDIEGDRKPQPRQRTRMKMLWDDQNLYIAAQIDE
ncbi:MAG: sugar-binding protein, partial [Gemmataceae bacterium]